jgi:hypothetical protein
MQEGFQATMELAGQAERMYDFRTLSPLDFEELVRDLLPSTGASGLRREGAAWKGAGRSSDAAWRGSRLGEARVTAAYAGYGLTG